MHEDDLLLTAPPRQRMWRFLLLFLITAVVFVTTYALILPAITAEPETLLEGDLSDTISYKLTQAGEIYTLTISGTGGMPGYNNSTQSLESRPWQPYLENITSFVVTEGITSVGQGACNGCTFLTSVTLPDSVNTLVAYAFTDCKALKEIVLPESVTTIGAGVFKGCTALESVIMPGVTRVQSSAFNGCTSLKNIDLSHVTYFERGAFSFCKSLTEISLSDELKTLPSSLFNGCSSLTTVNLPDGLTGIDGYVFANCKSLQSIAPLDEVTSIGAYAFSGCSSLTSIDLPSVTTIGESAFKGCSALVTVELPKTENTLTSIGVGAFQNCSSLQSITIPEGVTALQHQIFNGCSSLETVSLPESLTAIGGNVFQGCKALTSIHIPAAVTTIGNGSESTFSNCSSLTTVTFGEGSKLQSIGTNSFVNCTALTSIDLPDTVTTMGTGVFSGCSSLTKANIPDGVTTVSASLFAGCSSLTTVEISDNVTSIGEKAVSGCKALKTIKLPDGITEIPDRAFQGCTFTEFHIPDSVTSIGSWAFANCAALKEITFPSKLKIIKDNAFNACYGLNSITFAENSSLEKIDVQAFMECSSLISVELPEGMKTLGGGAFKKCSKLTTITLPSTLTEIKAETFMYDYALKEIYIPASVTAIGNSAFKQCKTLTKVEIGEGSQLRSIGTNAFSECMVLESINLPEGLTGIGGFAFYQCQKLDNVTLPSTLESLGNGSECAFAHCKSLSSINIPAELTTIPYQTFYGCTSLGEVTMEEGVTTIGGNAFYLCLALHSINLADTVTSLGAGCFYGAGLKEADMSAELTTIGDKAFANTTLTELTIPEKVTSIGAQAFSSSRLLETVYWNATACETLDPTAFNSGIGEEYTVVIGAGVDSLPSGFGETLTAALNGSVVFAGPNEGIALSPADMAGLDYPLCDLNGTYCVDGQGLVYTADGKTLVYCPPGLGTCTVPAGVTTVAPQAFMLAEDLTAVTFAAPEQITSIGTAAFAGCEALTAVNGKTTVADAAALFTTGVVAENAFDNTGLTDAVVPKGVADTLTYTNSGANLLVAWPSNNAGTFDAATGYYHLLTGEAGLPIIAAETKDATGSVSDLEFHVFMEFSNGDFSVPSFTVGETVYMGDNKTPVTMYATDRPNVYYLAFTPAEGETLSFTLAASYPALLSGGGTMHLWGKVVKTGTAVSSVRPKEFHAYRWLTEWQEYTTTWEVSSNPILTGLGDGSSTATLGGNLVYQIEHAAQGSVPSADYGRNPLQRISYTVGVDLPEGMWWDPALIMAIDEGTYRFRITTTSVPTLQVTYPDADGVYRRAFQMQLPNTDTSQHLAPISLSREGDAITVAFDRYQNGNTTDTATGRATFAVINTAVYADADDWKGKNPITTTLDTVYHYTWSEDVADHDDGIQTTPTPTANLVTNKSRITTATNNEFYMGQTVEYRITVNNNAAKTYTALGDVIDPLDKLLYIAPADMERMFAADCGDLLTITIDKAQLYQYDGPATAIATDGKTAVALNVANSAKDTAPKTATVAVKKAQNGYTLTYTVDGEEPVTQTCTDVAAGLEAIGYAVTEDAKYTALWDYTGVSIYGGIAYNLPVYATHKNSFNNLTEDWNFWYAWNTTDPQTVSNLASKTLSGKVSNVSGTITHQLYYDASVFKWLSKDGKVYNEDTEAEITFHDQDFLDYTVNYNHTGSGVYTDLPVVDVMTGAQALLVPVEQNKDRPWAGGDLPVVTRDGVEYYRLEAADTYNGVWVGTNQNGKPLYADSVTVTLTGNNRTTTVKWYVSKLTGTVQNYINYTTQVLAGEEYLFSFNNTVYLNDKTGDRLKCSIGGGGTALAVQKQIVSANPDTDGDNAPAEQLDEDDYSILDANSTVTYKISLLCTGDGKRVLSSEEIFDRLPQTFGAFAWELGRNLSVTVRGEGATIALSDPYITTEAPGDRWEAAAGQYYLCWNGGEIAFDSESAAYIYVTLTYPAKGDVWDDYCEGSGGVRIENTVYVYGFPDNVVHDLRGESVALLQKGVSQITDRYVTSNAVNAMFANNATRHYYSNSNLLEYTTSYGLCSYVQYYVSIYNSGSARLYLSDLQDQLPAGFTFCTLSDGATDRDNFHYASEDSFRLGAVKKLTTTVNGCQSLANIGNSSEPITYVTSTITVTGTGQALTFSIGAGTDEATSVHYDEKEERYYLLKGEALVFGYVVQVGSQAQTEDIATNVIGMPCYDPLQSVLTLDTATKVTGSDVVTATYNDGAPALITPSKAAEYGFTIGDETQWFASDVTLRRGTVVPGISKSIKTKETQGSPVVPYDGVALPEDRLGWQIRLQNDGMRNITNFTFTDTMQSPYSFEGEVSFQQYLSNGRMYAYADLFTIERDADGGVTIVGYDNTNYVLTLGKSTRVFVQYYLKDNQQSQPHRVGVYVTFQKEANGDETLSIRFTGMLALRMNEYALITVHTENNSGSRTNAVFANRAVFKPTEEYDERQIRHGINTTDASGNNAGVLANSFVTVATGYSTTSKKAVTAKNDPQNTAASTDSENAIVLAKSGDLFTYTLEVHNSSGNAMSKLILIDNLPQPDDCFTYADTAPRGSTVTAVLAPDPALSVVITDEDGNKATLTADKYRVESSAKTTFTLDDRSGVNTDGWNAAVADTRSLRITINDPSGVTIPKGATVTVSFDCVLDAPQAGGVAWNSFGYHYGLAGVNIELEAAPLEVGVKVPAVPVLTKLVTDRNGKASPLAQDTDFTFLIYEGAALADAPTDEAALKAALDAQDRAYHTFAVTVADGSSESAAQQLQAEDWSWVDGKTYTIVELPLDDTFRFDVWNGADRARAYTFVYENDLTLLLTATNTLRQWDFQLAKTDSRDAAKRLGGAVFALYSPAATDQMPQETFDALETNGVEYTLSIDGETWYLTDVKTTTAAGTASWSDLIRESYYVKEVQPPKGYYLLNDGFLVSRPTNDGETTVFQTVANEAIPYSLPETGGKGSTPLYAAGAILVLSACALYSFILLRKRKARSS